jgi:predicted ABC-type ATPase
MHGRMARGGHGLPKSVTKARHAKPYHALRAVTTETAVSEVAAHKAVF